MNSSSKWNSKHARSFVAIAAIGFLLIAFQNCGGNFQASQQASSQAGVSGTDAQGQSMSAVLTWDKSTSPNIKGYRIYLGSSSGTFDRAIDAGATVNPTAPEFELVNLDPVAVVKAYDAAGAESIASNEITPSR